MSDDLLDIASESRQSGKTPGTDLREGIHTLPMLYALADDGGWAIVDTGAQTREALANWTRALASRSRSCPKRICSKRAS